jgi:hypothetical protein
MLLDGTFRPCVHRTAPPVGPTLVMLGNTGRNAAKRPPRHYTVVRNNRSTHGRIGQSNIPRPRSANNGGMACTEEAEGSSCGNRQASQSNPLVLPFLDTHTLGGSSCTPPLTMRRGPEVSDDNNPSTKRMKRIVQTNVAGTSTVELWNLSSEVEGELRTNYGDRPMSKEMMSVKTMTEMYARKPRTTQTSASDNLWAEIAVPSVDRAVSVQLL